MMDLEFLTQILLVLLIVATILLIAVLWRAYQIQADVKEITEIASKRVKEIDKSVERIKNSATNLVDMFKNFLFSFDLVKKIRNNIKNNQKGEGNE